MNKINDPRYIRCEELLQETLKQMIEQNNFDSITITGLSKKAGLNRKTFYLHYQSIDDLLFATLNKLNIQKINKDMVTLQPYLLK